jgi:heparosan-N-sulfate-glucuronate 5-epimerase
MAKRIQYLRRIGAAYLTGANSQLTFWHETPQVNERAGWTELGDYYMPFEKKAAYSAHLDKSGIPQLNYHGTIGVQYNPIAIAQYGLGNYNLYRRSGDCESFAKFINVANWLVENLTLNRASFPVWNHYFDWDYRTPLRAPWYSGLAQGQGISVLVRAHAETRNGAYLDAAAQALKCFDATVDRGGVGYVDPEGNYWIEEYIVHPAPPTHILNGFMWASWGLWDYVLATGDPKVRGLFDKSVETIAGKLAGFDTGYWSMYEQSGTRMRMLASPFYHALHIVQLQVLYRITGKPAFDEFARRWQGYCDNRLNRYRSLVHKSVFKVFYY